jgi:hypothetical protein
MQSSILFCDYKVPFRGFRGKETVANQCPAAGAEAVFRARAMLALVNDSIVYDDDMACLQVGIYRETAIETDYFDFELIPNPAGDRVTLKINNAQEGFCHINILNILGNKVLETKVDCQQLEHIINTNSLQPGMYFVDVEFEQKQIVKKLLIIR